MQLAMSVASGLLISWLIIMIVYVIATIISDKIVKKIGR